MSAEWKKMKRAFLFRDFRVTKFNVHVTKVMYIFYLFKLN